MKRLYMVFVEGAVQLVASMIGDIGVILQEEQHISFDAEVT